MRIAVILFGLLASPLFGQNSTKPRYEAKLIPDIVYQKIGDREIKIDLALPTRGQGPFPTVLCVHGGAWRMGSRKELTGLIQLLADRGYVAASVQYRLVPDVMFQQQIEDVKTSVRWLRENAQTYSIDPKKIGSLGFSAGGHLVCLLGTTNPKHGFEGTLYPKQSSEVQCVVDYFGPTDLTAYGKDESAQNAVFEPLLGGRFLEKPELFRKASPLTYVSKDCPPLLAIHGTKDRLVPFSQSEQLVEKLTKLGADAKLVTVKGGDHGFFGDDQKRTTREMLGFLEKNLKK